MERCKMKPATYALAIFFAFSLMGCQSQHMQAKVRPAPLALPAAAPGEIVVKLQPSKLKRVGSTRFTSGWFGIPNFEEREEKLVRGEMKVDGEKVVFYIPEDGPYELTTKEDEFSNTSMRVSVDANNDDELPDTEAWFSSTPIRVANSMLNVRKVDPAGTWITFAKADVPLAGLVVGKPCPDFEFSTMDGKKVKLADYKGKSLLLDVWSMT